MASFIECRNVDEMVWAMAEADWLEEQEEQRVEALGTVGCDT